MSHSPDFRADAAWARAQDDADPLRALRGEFLIPPHGDGEQTYLVGNSLGLQPRGVRQALLDELDDWARLGVEGHLHARHPWLPYHREVRDGLAEVVGAEPIEVVAMNSLTANLHLLMASFYRPTPERHAILIERNAFPSDRDLAASQIRFHGHDPAEALIELDGDEPGGTLSLAAIERALAGHGQRVALVLLPGVQYLTGQSFDLAAITKLAHAQGCVAGFDCAHAAGVRSRTRRRRLAVVQSADPCARAAARVAGTVRARGHAAPAREIETLDRVPRVADRNAAR